MNITLDSVSKYYSDQGKTTKGIENVSLSFNTDGSFVVITGESGSGKSTLIKILTGLSDIDEGEILFDGKLLSGLTDEERHQLYFDNISFVFQDYNLIESLTSKENVVLALLKKGYTNKDAGSKAEEVLKEVGLADQINTRTSKLSGGERQRVAIARSLAVESKIIIFDEPTGNLDTATSQKIIQLIGKVTKNRLVIYVTHDYSQVKEYVTRHIVLSDGHVIKDTLVKKATSSNAEVESKKKNKPNPFAWFYSAALFSFKRIGRLLASFVGLLMISLAVFGVSYGSSITLLNQAQSTENESYSLLENSFGNTIEVKKNNFSDEDKQFSDDCFFDQGGLVNQTEGYFYTVDDLLSAGTGSDLLKPSLSAPLVSYLPCDYWIETDFPVEEGKEAAYLVFYNGPYLTNSSSYASALSLIGKKTFIAPFGNSIQGLSYYRQQMVGIISNGPNVVIKGLILTSDYRASKICSTNPLVLVTSKTMEEEAALSKDLLFDVTHDVVPALSKVYPLFGFSNCDIRDAKGASLMSNESAYTSYANKNSLATYNTLFLSEDQKNQDISILINGIEVPSSEFNVVYCPLDSGSSIYSNTYFVSSQTIGGISYNHNLLSFYTFSNRQEALNAYSQVTDRKAILFDEVKEYSFSVIDLSSVSVNTRFTVLGMFVLLSLALVVIMIIIHLVLDKFYYRKTYDQMVLSYVGYSRKDNIIINFIQFVFLSLVSLLISYPILFTVVPSAKWAFLAMPWLFVIGVLLEFLFNFALSVPRKTRGDKHD
jgi:ABC-type lipoprotein export system ATPase subunit